MYSISANIRLCGNWGGHLPASSLSRYPALVFRLTVGRIVKRKTKSCTFILSTIGRADIAPNIPTALSGVVMRQAF